MFKSTALLVVAAGLVAAQGPYVPFTQLTQCANSALTFTDTVPPYYVAILHAEDPCGMDSLAEYHDVWTTSVDYYANLPEGTNVLIYVSDGNGAESFSDPIWVAGGDSSCLGAVSNDQQAPPADAPPADDQQYAPESYSQDAPQDAPQDASQDAPENVAEDTTPSSSAVPPASSSTVPMTYSVDRGSTSNDNTFSNPVNAANSNTDISGASSVTISLTTVGLAVFAAMFSLF